MFTRKNKRKQNKQKTRTRKNEKNWHYLHYALTKPPILNRNSVGKKFSAVIKPTYILTLILLVAWTITFPLTISFNHVKWMIWVTLKPPVKNGFWLLKDFKSFQCLFKTHGELLSCGVFHFVPTRYDLIELCDVRSRAHQLQTYPWRKTLSLALHSGINFAKALFCQLMKEHQWAVGSLSSLFRYEASFRWEKGLKRHLRWGTNFFGKRKNLNFLPTSFSRCSLLAVENLFLLFCCSADLRTIRKGS